MGGDNVSVDGSNQSGTWKFRRDAEWIIKRVRHVLPTAIKQSKQTTKENIDCWRFCGSGGEFEGGALLNALQSHEVYFWRCHAKMREDFVGGDVVVV